MFGIGFTELILIVSFSLFVVLPFWKIYAKAGFPAALSLLQLIPLVNVVALFYLAFAEWPALRKHAEPK